MNNNFLNIYTDGGSRGNPGPSACAFVVYNSQNEVVFQQGIYIGIGTNNNAEYLGVLTAYQRLSSLTQKPDTLHFYLDSELVVNQLSGLFKIKDPNLYNLSLQIKEYQKNYSVIYTHIPRSQNSAADLLVNHTLDNR